MGGCCPRAATLGTAERRPGRAWSTRLDLRPPPRGVTSPSSNLARSFLLVLTISGAVVKQPVRKAAKGSVLPRPGPGRCRTGPEPAPAPNPYTPRAPLGLGGGGRSPRAGRDLLAVASPGAEQGAPPRVRSVSGVGGLLAGARKSRGPLETRSAPSPGGQSGDCRPRHGVRDAPRATWEERASRVALEIQRQS